MPAVQRIGNRRRSSSPVFELRVQWQRFDLALHAIQLSDQLDGRCGNRALARQVQLDELAPRMRHAADLGHAEC